MNWRVRIDRGPARPQARRLTAARRGTVASRGFMVVAGCALLLGAPLSMASISGSPHPEDRLAKGKFLVATRSLRDPNFAQTVVLIVDYDEQGALGVVVNRPTGVPLTEALPDIEELRTRPDRVHLGGPVARDRMVLLLRTGKAPPESVRVFDTVYASGSIDALRASVTRGTTLRAYAGYAGWGPGQLDAEVSRGDWLIGPADSKSIFDERPERIWEKLLERFNGEWAGRSGGQIDTAGLVPADVALN